MTFSIAGRCPDTGQFGVSITTSNLAVGQRCVSVRHRVGAFLSQHRTDPRLHREGIELMSGGLDASAAVEAVAAATEHRAWRQLAAIDSGGRTGVYHGEMMYSIYADAAGPRCVAIGNILDNPEVPSRMVEAFESHKNDTSLADRLLSALEAGAAHGGEVTGPLRSAALLVSGEDDLATCDLRVDLAEDAVAQLRMLYEAYRPSEEVLRGLALDPGRFPVARTLFDASVKRIDTLRLGERFPSRADRHRWEIAD